MTFKIINYRVDYARPVEYKREMNFSHHPKQTQMIEPKLLRDILIGTIVTVGSHLISINIELFESISSFFQEHEQNQLDEYFLSSWMLLLVIIVIIERARSRRLSKETEEIGIEKLQTIADSIDEVITIFDPTTLDINYVSPSIEKLLGFTPLEFKMSCIDSNMTASSTQKIRYHTKKITGKNGTKRTESHPIELEYIRKDGTHVFVDLTIKSIYNKKEYITEIVGIIRNATRRKNREDSLVELSLIDDLTQIPNKKYFNNELEYFFNSDRHKSEKLALLYLDLDGFKDINDTLGHDTGDLVLKEVAARLKSCLRESDSTYRLGGDEFTVILKNSDEQAYVSIAQRIHEKISGNYVFAHQHIDSIRASIGISFYPTHTTNKDELVRLADKAMYKAKKGNIGVHVYNHHTQLKSDSP